MARRVMHTGPVGGDTVFYGDDHHTINRITTQGHAVTDVYTPPGHTRDGFITRNALRDAHRTQYGNASWEIPIQSS